MSNKVTNKELQDLLKHYPDDAIIIIEFEYCNIRNVRYNEDANLLIID